MNTKFCTKCKCDKHIEEFRTLSNGKKYTYCISCVKEYSRQYHIKNAQHINEASRRWRAENKEKKIQQSKSYYERNKEKVLKKNSAYAKKNVSNYLRYTREWVKRNPDKNRARSMRRHAYKLKATATWEKELTDFVFLEAQNLAVIRQQATGFKWHVDHVIPLRGAEVCGLHVWNNFAVIPACENIKKRNKFNENTVQFRGHLLNADTLEIV